MNKVQKQDIMYLKGVGPKRAEAFEKLGIKYAEDVLRIYPRDYIYRASIAELKNYSDKNVMIFGTITEKQLPRRHSHPLRITVSDETGRISCLIWGNLIYREKQFKTGEKIILWGKAGSSQFEEVEFAYRDHKKYDPSDEVFLKHPMIPLYILSGELKKTWMKPLHLTKVFFIALISTADKIKEILPESILSKYSLLCHKDAIMRLHYPKSDEDKETARQTLAFEELFFLQLVMALRKKMMEGESKPTPPSGHPSKEGILREMLQFELTDAQKKVIKEIRADMESSKAMNRLLQGDVGSGKTIVVIFCMLAAIENGYQCAFMAPTEILAEQHNKVLKGYFDRIGVNAVLLIGGQKKKVREQVLQDIRLGKADVVIGTHALFQEAVEFKNLGFAVIDEQHKFGVLQRARLREKGMNPDVLVMTATPIPRTLSLTIYGDLDVSVIDELPKGRKPVKTALRFEKDRLKIYDFIRKEVKDGRQVYIVYPIIEQSEKLDLKSAVKHYDILKDEVFKDLRVGLVHGRLFWYEIDETVENFKNKKIDILVTTTVIEVGIDIPNATIMLIEEAQRFGLSQLHQLRGRVGRGAEQSYCILMSDEKLGEAANVRLQTLVETNDGFKISEVDLKLRGPGEFFGTRQAGELKFSAADLSRDMNLLLKARTEAFELINHDTQLLKPENVNIRNHFLENYKQSMDLIKVA